ncbi:dienelactone hydrolase family protein [Catellatospora sp. NPDC049609]|uniref:dienelactone hydrolase family protein n=1 Tax=Catellatospora sp. NPDC049609 TaxID=3155505 RepID=UPI00342DBD57
MSEFSEYLSSEVVVDYADGLISRREALHRLALLGVGAAVAVPLLAACESRRADPATAPTGTPGPVPSGPAGPSPLPTQPVTFPGPQGRELRGAFAAAVTPRGSVLVVHENKGLTDHIASVAGRLAAAGWSALAIDLLSEEGGTARFTDPAQATAALNAAPPERLLADLRAGIDELLRRGPGHTVGAMGFCFGGGMVWSLLAAGEPRLHAAVPFYGPFPAGASLSGSPQAAVLGVYAQLDDRVNASRDAAGDALRQAGLTHEIVTYPDVNHAFFNDTGARYNAAAASQAWAKLTAWFGEHLA